MAPGRRQAAKERAIPLHLRMGSQVRAALLLLAAPVVLTCIMSASVRAQSALPLPAAAGDAPPPAAIAGLLDARPVSPLEFSRAWLAKVENVRRRRAELHAAGRLDGLTPEAAALAGAALKGTLRVPVIPIRYSDVAEPFSFERLQDRLFGPQQGDTLSFASYWSEVSNGLLQVEGRVTPWVTLPKSASYYLPREQYGWGQFGKMVELRSQVLRAADRMLDFSHYDNDGPDGVPNSADDDGYVDFVAFVYAVPCPGDGRAGAIWPHRAAMQPFITNDPGANGERIKIADYVILPAVDPATCGPMHIGVLAHETGHALGLPDLYDYDGSSQGIGAWGLMGTGSHNAQHSPAHPSAWEKEQLGWVSVSWLNSMDTLVFEPVAKTQKVYRYDLPNSSGSYILLENRQRIGSDQFLPGEGLLAWRIDPERGELGAWNTDERRSAVTLIDADGRNDLANGMRADAGDPFPGTKRRDSFGELRSLRLTNIREVNQDIVASVRVGYALPSLVPNVDAVRLTAVAGDTLVERRIRITAHGEVGTWSARASDDWLRTTTVGDTLVVQATPNGLPPGRYTEVLDLHTESGLLAGRVTVEFYVTRPGVPEIIATDLPWSWGLATHDGNVLQASYGWDAFGLRPRPRVLQIRDGQAHPSTLSRIASDALFAPVFAADGRSSFAIARARDANYVYRIRNDGSAVVIASDFGTTPAYGSALLPDGTLLVSEWNGTIWRIAEGLEPQVYTMLGTNLYQIATDREGTLYAATYDGRILRCDRNGVVQTTDTGFKSGRFVSLAVTADGTVYAGERGGDGRIFRFDPSGKRQTIYQSKRSSFYGLSVDSHFLFALDLYNRKLLRIPLEQPANVVATLEEN